MHMLKAKIMPAIAQNSLIHLFSLVSCVMLSLVSLHNHMPDLLCFLSLVRLC